MIGPAAWAWANELKAAVQAAAVGGALVTLALLFLLARRSLYSNESSSGERAMGTVLLTGVMLASFAAALMSLMLSLAPDGRLRTMVFWLLGDLTRGDRWGWLLTLLAAATLFCVALGRPLNVLARGETIAATVGLDVRRVRSIVFVLSSLLTGCAVSTAGSIGFVGLVTPHLVRLALGNDQRIVLAGSALLGGLVLMTADLASRLLLAPRQLPVGALTALVGVPIFLLLMLRQRN